MSNQRPGKWKTATLRDGSGMQTVTFFKTARKLLEEYGHEDAAFYFEQVEEHLRQGGGLPNDSNQVGTVLGVCRIIQEFCVLEILELQSSLQTFMVEYIKGGLKEKQPSKSQEELAPFLHLTKGAIS